MTPVLSICQHFELPIVGSHRMRPLAGHFYECNTSSPSRAPRIHICNATYLNATTNLRAIGGHEDLAQTCVPTSAWERAEAASVPNFNATSSSLFECTTSSDPRLRYTETGFSCGYSQYSGFNDSFTFGHSALLRVPISFFFDDCFFLFLRF